MIDGQAINTIKITAKRPFSSSYPLITTLKSSHPEVFLGKYVPKICSKCTGEHSCRSAISIKLLCNFIEIALRHGCAAVNLLDIFRKSFIKNTSRWLLLNSATLISRLLNIQGIIFAIS